MMEALNSSHACLQRAARACSVQTSQSSTSRFDLQPAAAQMLGFLFHQVLRGSREEMQEVLRGAHVVLEDVNHSAYRFLTTLPGAYRRVSSHVSERPQYGIPEGRVLCAALVGAIRNTTW